LSPTFQARAEVLVGPVTVDPDAILASRALTPTYASLANSHPIIEDDVTIYSGATILGRIRIGAGSVIGGNVWVTHDVPRGSRISQVEARRGEFVDGGGI